MSKISIGHLEGSFAKSIKAKVSLEKKSFSHFKYTESLSYL